MQGRVPQLISRTMWVPSVHSPRRWALQQSGQSAAMMSAVCAPKFVTGEARVLDCKSIHQRDDPRATTDC